MPSDPEIEIKFAIADIPGLSFRLEQAGFRLVTERTHELNTLYDLPDGDLRRQGSILRIRQFGPRWILTYKGKTSGPPARHKSRPEIETTVEDGEALARILESLGYRPTFRYEKFRSEWTDARGYVVIDETPIGNYGEIEGPPDWIDATARRLELADKDYITASYSELFIAWRKQSKSPATDMTFAAVGA